MVTATAETSSATPTTQRERKKLPVRRPYGAEALNETAMHIAMAITATTPPEHCCQGRGVQRTVRIRLIGDGDFGDVAAPAARSGEESGRIRLKFDAAGTAGMESMEIDLRYFYRRGEHTAVVALESAICLTMRTDSKKKSRESVFAQSFKG